MTFTLNRCGLLAMLMAALFALSTPLTAYAQEDSDSASVAAEEVAAEPVEEPADLGLGFAIDNAMLFMCAVLVFFMQAGFAMVEAGFNSSKNAVNILFKNSMDICVGVLLFYTIGFGIMYPFSYEKFTDQFDKISEEEPDEEAATAAIDKIKAENGYFAFGGFGLDHYTSVGRFSPETDWLFQAMFAATAATIVSGAVAGRMKVGGYLIYSAVITALIYPVSGMWKWGGGWLAQMGFMDFAGSAVVHGVGGFAGLAGAMIIGPRIGRYVDGKSIPMPGHSLPLAALGVFILWFGWYGFNPGSQLAFHETSNMNVAMHCAVTTTLAAGAGGLVATLLSWVLFGKPDLSMGLNGILGGLVGITACCDVMNNWEAMAVGSIAAVIVIAGVMLLDKLMIDDPVGAFPVHGLCGVWGCLAIGVFGKNSFMTQLIGTAAICGWAFVTMLALFLILKAVGLLRVSAEEEQKGLDVSEHGMAAYTH
ncbi:Ammonia channel precursor [Pirellulimonas nuda]|uniref:Ammonia channel n=1 Tax=Pirellulimonas nuda TaxID=2528009 RepID=A0A518DB10_9BACT|nr:ammonium transporter [Pirellulimonas nuda]QDU88633.1 Ammonia channel precursor [Pirellulimonas nuda]